MARFINIYQRLNIQDKFILLTLILMILNPAFLINQSQASELDGLNNCQSPNFSNFLINDHQFYSKLTHEQLEIIIGQKLILTVYVNNIREKQLTADYKILKRLLHSGKIGGLFINMRSINTGVAKRKYLKFIKFLQIENMGIKPFIAVDEEGGSINSLSKERGFSGNPISALNVAKKYDYNQALANYISISQDMKANKINMNFAPVVDLNINKQSRIIAKFKRSYHSQPDIVTKYAHSSIKASLKNNILPVLKHFPGHGSSTEDSHKKIPDITNSWTETELHPYQSLQKFNCSPAIMLGHLYHPLFSDGKKPASLSRKAINYLRNHMAFKGLIITDAIDMLKYQDGYSDHKYGLEAIKSGSDMILFTSTLDKNITLFKKIFIGAKQAIKEGELSLIELQKSSVRIKAAKEFIRSSQ